MEKERAVESTAKQHKKLELGSEEVINDKDFISAATVPTVVWILWALITGVSLPQQQSPLWGCIGIPSALSRHLASRERRHCELFVLICCCPRNRSSNGKMLPHGFGLRRQGQGWGDGGPPHSHMMPMQLISSSPGNSSVSSSEGGGNEAMMQQNLNRGDGQFRFCSPSARYPPPNYCGPYLGDGSPVNMWHLDYAI